MTTWILLRGLTRERGHWGDFPDLLARGLPGSTVVAMDLPGNGRQNQRRSPSRIEDMVHACRHEAQTLGLPRPYRLLAMSLGAMVAIEWARLDPAALAGCVLLNTSLRSFQPWHRRLRPVNYWRLAKVAVGGGSMADREREILRLTSTRAAVLDPVVATWARLRIARPVSAANAVRQLLAAARYVPPAGPPAVALLVLVGSKDGLVDPRCSLDLACRWGTDIAVHPNAGHDLPLDDPAWVIGEVSAWLSGATPDGRG